MRRIFFCIDKDCEEEFHSLTDWTEHMREEHERESIGPEDVEQAIYPDAERKERGKNNESLVGVRLRLKDRVALEELAEERKVTEPEVVRQLLREHVERVAKEKAPVTRESFAAGLEVAARFLTAFAGSGKPECGCKANSDDLRDDARRLNEELSQFADNFKTEQMAGRTRGKGIFGF